MSCQQHFNQNLYRTSSQNTLPVILISEENNLEIERIKLDRRLRQHLSMRDCDLSYEQARDILDYKFLANRPQALLTFARKLSNSPIATKDFNLSASLSHLGGFANDWQTKTENDWSQQLIARIFVNRQEWGHLDRYFQHTIGTTNNFWLENIWRDYFARDHHYGANKLQNTLQKIFIDGYNEVFSSNKETLLRWTGEVFDASQNPIEVSWLMKRLQDEPFLSRLGRESYTPPDFLQERQKRMNANTPPTDKAIIWQALEEIFNRDHSIIVDLEKGDIIERRGIDWNQDYLNFLLWWQQQPNINWRSNILERFAQDFNIPQPLGRHRRELWQKVVTLIDTEYQGGRVTKISF